MFVKVNLENLSIETIKAMAIDLWASHDWEGFAKLTNYLERKVDRKEIRALLDELGKIENV